MKSVRQTSAQDILAFVEGRVQQVVDVLPVGFLLELVIDVGDARVEDLVEVVRGHAEIRPGDNELVVLRLAALHRGAERLRALVGADARALHAGSIAVLDADKALVLFGVLDVQVLANLGKQLVVAYAHLVGGTYA